MIQEEEEEEVINVMNQLNFSPLFDSGILSTGNRYYLQYRDDYIISYCRKKYYYNHINDDIPLFVDNVWPGSLVLSDYLCEIYKDNKLLEGKRSIELGAGCALPSLVLKRLGIEYSTITDYPAIGVIENIQELIEKNNLSNIFVKPHIWGSDVNELLLEQSKYDIVLVAECLWKDTYSLHIDLLTSIYHLLSSDGCAYISFAHRPSFDKSHNKENDLEFFEHAKSMKLKEEKILSTKKYRDALEEEFIVVHLYSLKHI